MNAQSKFMNAGRMEFEGVISLSSGAAVNTVSQLDGTTKTVTGVGQTCTKSTTGTYLVVCKTASLLATNNEAVFQPVELLDASAKLVAATVATALGARVSLVQINTATGNLEITVLTTQTSGAAADTTAAVLLAFHVVIAITRQDGVV